MRLSMKLAQKVKNIFKKGSDSFFFQQIVDTITEEMKAKVKKGSDGLYVPNYYQVLFPTLKKEDSDFIIKDDLKAALNKWINKNNLNLRQDLELKFIYSKSIKEPVANGEFIINTRDVEQTIDEGTKIFNLGDIETDDTDIIDFTLKIKPVLQRECSLKLINDGQVIKKFEIDSVETNIGRQETNEIVLSDKNISRVHAQIVNKKYYYIIRDLDSTNGVIVNGELIKEKQLVNGDQIKLGLTELEFSLER